MSTQNTTKRSSLLLALGYAIGQGSVFLVLISARQLGYLEVSGILVIVIGMLSFCFQFGDFGNPTLLVNKISKGEISEAQTYIRARTTLAIIICAIFSTWIYINRSIEEMWMLAIFLPFIGLICGNFHTSFIESKGDYLKLAIVNAIPWISLAISTVFFFTNLEKLHSMILAVMITALGCAIAWRISKEFFAQNYIAIGKSQGSIKTLIHATPFVLSPLGGQVWFRYVIVDISSIVSLAALGAMGIAKNIQTAVILIIGFIARPSLRKYIIETTDSGKDISIFGVLRSYQNAFYISAAAPIFVITLGATIGFNDDVHLTHWLPIVAIVPLVILGQATAATNQLRHESKHVLFADYSSLLANVLVFITLVKRDPVAALIASESVYAASQLTIYAIRCKILKKSL